MRKQDVGIAKNYLDEEELAALNNLVEQYLVFAEGQAMRRTPMHMNNWIEKLHGFLTLNDRSLLMHAGKISHELAIEIAEREYDNFQAKRITEEKAKEGEFEKAIKKLPKSKKK